MIPLILFSIVAAMLVLLIGRKDSARDPRLTLTLLIVLMAYPLICIWMPKLVVVQLPGPQASQGGFGWGPLLQRIWVLGSLIAGLRLIFATFTLRLWKRQSALVEKIEGIEIRSLKRITSPVATGIIRRIVYVPDSWTQQAEETRRIILAHELNHHRRLDPLWKLLAELACVIHWFNPLVHWMSRRLALQCELACDADVLNQGADQSSYARLLCDLASSEQHPTLAIGMAGRSTLEERVHRIMKPRHRANVLVMLACGLLGVGSALALSVMTSHKQPVLSPVQQDAQLRLTADPFPGNHP